MVGCKRIDDRKFIRWIIVQKGKDLANAAPQTMDETISGYVAYMTGLVLLLPSRSVATVLPSRFILGKDLIKARPTYCDPLRPCILNALLSRPDLQRLCICLLIHMDARCSRR